MRGIEISTRHGFLGEKKWDIQRAFSSDLVSRFSEIDIAVIKSLKFIGDGELCSVGMLFKFYELCKRENAGKNFSIFAETFLFITNTLVYDEFRHGLLLKQLNHLISNGPDPVNEIAAEELAQQYFDVNDIWSCPFEALISQTFGEITNSILYREAAKLAENEELKELLSNVSKDEIRHKLAWKNLTIKIINASEESRARYISALATGHVIHQAEVGRTYARGLLDTMRFFSAPIIEEVVDDKLSLVEEILGCPAPFNKEEILKAQNVRFRSFVSQLRRK